MNTEQLLEVVTNALSDLKAQDITVLNVRDLCTITDAMVIASGHSRRQVIALARHVVERVKAHGKQPLGEEGSDVGEWSLVDLGDIVVHVMQPQIRDFYQLEKLWSVNPNPSLLS